MEISNSTGLRALGKRRERKSSAGNANPALETQIQRWNGAGMAPEIRIRRWQGQAGPGNANPAPETGIQRWKRKSGAGAAPREAPGTPKSGAGGYSVYGNKVFSDFLSFKSEILLKKKLPFTNFQSQKLFNIRFTDYEKETFPIAFFKNGIWITRGV